MMGYQQHQVSTPVALTGKLQGWRVTLPYWASCRFITLTHAGMLLFWCSIGLGMNRSSRRSGKQGQESSSSLMEMWEVQLRWPNWALLWMCSSALVAHQKVTNLLTQACCSASPCAASLEMYTHIECSFESSSCCLTLNRGACHPSRDKGLPQDCLHGVSSLRKHHHQAPNVYALNLAGVIAAAALKCMGGTMQGRLWPRSDEERKKAEEAGYDISKVRLSSTLSLLLKLLQPWP